ncbi:MAG TPA: MmcQ/YjbR family DNA-binding protein [Caulobacteraceae bacterium]|nr:MmcQ/YjbR family DNA-binding protein [Caulobacteraceae bacterium]
MSTPEEIRRLALAMPGAEEADHHGIASFRVGGKIFCTLHVAQPRLMAKLSNEDQHNLVAAHPGVVEAVPGYWGRKGSTFIWHENADGALLALAIDLAWRNVAPKRLSATGRAS